MNGTTPAAWPKPALVLSLIAFLLWLVTRIRYVIDDRYVRVKLGAVTLRKIALADIEFADTAAPLWNEHWCNTFIVCGRVVRLRRKTGLIRNFIITPENRAAFLDELRRKRETPPQ